MQESDPHGKNPHEPGAKLDDGKIMAGLCIAGFSRALTEVSKVTTYGAKKYTPNGWCKVENGIQRYSDAMYRHLLAEQDDFHDAESGLLHAAHAAWNALARLELYLRLTQGPVPAPEPEQWVIEVDMSEGHHEKVREWKPVVGADWHTPVKYATRDAAEAARVAYVKVGSWGGANTRVVKL